MSRQGIRNGKVKKECSGCGMDLGKRWKKYRYCNACHAAHMRRKRPKHSELSEIQRKRANCRAHTKVYINRGKILRMDCWICGEKAEPHHEDYSNPKDVIWLCRKHHLEYHEWRDGFEEILGIKISNVDRSVLLKMQNGEELRKIHGDLVCSIGGEVVNVDYKRLLEYEAIIATKNNEIEVRYMISEKGILLDIWGIK